MSPISARGSLLRRISGAVSRLGPAPGPRGEGGRRDQRNSFPLVVQSRRGVEGLGGRGLPLVPSGPDRLPLHPRQMDLRPRCSSPKVLAPNPPRFCSPQERVSTHPQPSGLYEHPPPPWVVGKRQNPPGISRGLREVKRSGVSDARFGSGPRRDGPFPSLALNSS